MCGRSSEYALIIIKLLFKWLRAKIVFLTFASDFNVDDFSTMRFLIAQSNAGEKKLNAFVEILTIRCASQLIVQSFLFHPCSPPK